MASYSLLAGLVGERADDTGIHKWMDGFLDVWLGDFSSDI